MTTRIPILMTAVLLLASCDARNDLISTTLFDESASGTGELKNDTQIRNGTYELDGAVLVYDTGGISGPYRNNENIVMVIRPKNTGDRVVFDMYQFESEFIGSSCNNDYIRIYNGAGTTAPVIDTWCGSFNSFFLPWRFVANNSSGTLTIQWRSDASITYAGFYGQLSLMRTSQSYNVYGLRTTSFGGSAIRAIYETAGPQTPMQNHGVCTSTSLTAPSRTNGASCLISSSNTYGTAYWNLSGATAFTTYYVRAFLTQPSGIVLYSNTATVVPTTKAMPDFLGHGAAPHPGDTRVLD